MNGATAADRRALIERARHRLTKTRAPGMTRVGVHVLVDLAAEDLDRAIEIDERDQPVRQAHSQRGRPQWALSAAGLTDEQAHEGALWLAGSARDAEDGWELLEACGLVRTSRRNRRKPTASTPRRSSTRGWVIDDRP